MQEPCLWAIDPIPELPFEPLVPMPPFFHPAEMQCNLPPLWFGLPFQVQYEDIPMCLPLLSDIRKRSHSNAFGLSAIGEEAIELMMQKGILVP